MDWIYEVYHSGPLKRSTLFLTVNIIDRTLSAKKYHVNQFQLVGVAAILIASKVDGDDTYSSSSLSKLTDRAFDSPQIQRMENEIISLLDFDFNMPSPLFFLESFQEIMSENCRYLPADEYAIYNLELQIFELGIFRFPPSILALTALI